MENEKILSMLAPSFLPSTAVLEMTYKCNHTCIFCSCPWFNPSNDFKVYDEMNVDQWKKCILKLCEMGVCNFAFTGGEPLLKDGITEIIEFAASCTSQYIESKDNQLITRHAPPGLYLLSNGLAMKDEILDLCKKYKIHLSLSLPGLTGFKKHTGVDNAERILEWFGKAREKGVSTTAGITVTRLNIDELYENISAAFIAGAGNLLMNRFLPGGRGLQYTDELSLDIPQINKMLDTAEEILEYANRYGSVGTELPKCIINTEKYKRLSVGTRCSAAIDFFVIDPSGYIRVCNHSPVRLNHIDEIEQVKSHPYWKTFIVKDYLPGSCSGCHLITDCDGGCREAAHIVGKTVDAPDPILNHIQNRR